MKSRTALLIVLLVALLLPVAASAAPLCDLPGPIEHLADCSYDSRMNKAPVRFPSQLVIGVEK